MVHPQTNIIPAISFSQFYPEDASQGEEILSNAVCSAQLRLQYVINHRKIICSSEPPRSLISFVPIDLMAISETWGEWRMCGGQCELKRWHDISY